ncbi:putative Glutathione S-transferase kappa 1 [Venustampulla echinocandica]|uniref:Glutathione S-transferase kappa n=1 Tax=Venustampulla echinocandica TaxID=2656787 RepID=A0A370TUY9_9HELO|nr:putative Glutathione S-transferase kappa 1 [Venustampulla echinocandica]RDL39355.1 putative Glutathione S-transferase kappa 1 [Venustampulla echinocandica]
MGGHIDCYIDCVSPYTYMALTHLRKNRELLLSHGVTIEYHPIFLGGVNVGSGNKPPWTLPAKAKYGKFDLTRSKNHHGLLKIEAPPFFPPLSLLPQRSLCYVKATFPPEVYEETYVHLFEKLWTAPNQVDITQPDNFLAVLEGFGKFSKKEAEDILKAAGEKEWKDKLLENTQKALDLGAFGAPWLWVRNSDGKEEPFFGSDRFHFIWEFLGLPWQDIQILPPKQGDKAKL